MGIRRAGVGRSAGQQSGHEAILIYGGYFLYGSAPGLQLQPSQPEKMVFLSNILYFHHLMCLLKPLMVFPTADSFLIVIAFAAGASVLTGTKRTSVKYFFD